MPAPVVIGGGAVAAGATAKGIGAGALIKGLLGGGARTAAAGGFRSAAANTARGMAADAVTGGAKQGMKNFARGMTGKTSDDYKARVEGVNPETGEYLTPEERKARFKGFATGTKPGSQKLLSGGPTQTVTALPPSKGFNAAESAKSDASQEKVVNHLEKISGYLEKLLKIEESSLARLQDSILSAAREDEQSAAAAEEEKQEQGKKKVQKKENPVVKGIKKKAGGIFGFLMDLAMQFVGFKILDWISKPENREKVDDIVKFFQGVVSFIGTVADVIGKSFSAVWDFSVATIEKTIEGIKFFGEELKKFFSFEWLDLDAIVEAFKPVTSFFTETIPNAINSFVDTLENLTKELLNLPNTFVGIVDQLVNGFLGFLGLKPADTANIEEPPGDQPVPIKDGKGLLQDSSSAATAGQPTDKDQAEAQPEQMRRGGRIKGPTHGQGGVPIEAEGGEYVLNRRAVAAIGSATLDRINFDRYPAVGKNGGKAPGSVRKYGAGGAIQYFSVNDGSRNKKLQDGSSYSYSDLLQHHGAPEGVGKGAKRIDGWPKDYTLLKGPNLATSPNADIPTPVAGEVIYRKPTGASGNVLVIKGEGGMGNFAYSHLSKFGKAQVGDKVQKGEIIGTQGKTGGDYAEHLHLDAEKKGHEAFVNYITGGGPLKGRSAASSKDGDDGSNNNNSGNTTDTSKEKEGKRNEQADSDIFDAIKLFGKLLGGSSPSPIESSPPASGQQLSESQQSNNTLTMPKPAAGGDNVTVMEGKSEVSTGADESVMDGSELGFNFPPFWQAVYPINL